MDETTKNAPLSNAEPVSPKFQLLWIVISTLIASSFLYRPLTTFRPQEPRPSLINLDPNLVKDFGTVPPKVTIGLNINNFSEFEIIKGKFAFSGTVWFKFDPTFVSIDAIEKFTIESGEILEKSPPRTHIENGQLFVEYRIRARFLENLVYKSFPFDDHRIRIIISNDFVRPEEISFESEINNFILNYNINHIPGWQEQGARVKTGYLKTILKKDESIESTLRPAAIFYINYGHAGFRYILAILFPLVLIFYLSLFSFSFDPYRYFSNIISLSAGSITALIAYRFVIESISPSVGYFMASDYLFFSFLGLLFSIFFFDVAISCCLITKTKTLVVLHHVAMLIAIIFIVIRL